MELIIVFIVIMVTMGLETNPSEGSEYHISVQADTIIGKLPHFWESTGLCPPEPHQESYQYFLSEDERQNLAYIGSVPHAGIKQVRIHWLLDMVKLSTNHDGSLSCNFTLLDLLIDQLWVNNLRPGFEIMGNPSDWWTDFEESKQVYKWKDMITTLAKRYIDKYGIEYVSRWNFETWNEPDHKDFDNLNFTVQGYLNYYDACSEGLKAASPKLILGAPGASCRKPSFSVLCWALLDHCDNGINFFTKETGVRLDYISFHQKGEPPQGSSMYILEQELEKIDAIHTKFPGLNQVPIYNDEADPLVGWSKAKEWRADATYAAVVAKVIAQHQNILPAQYPHINYALLSNDNGFMNFNPSFFDQRTLTARFQINNTKPNYVDLIKKPVLSVMGLLALLGDQQIQTTDLVKVGDEYTPVGNDSDVGVIASVKNSNAENESWQMSILIYNSPDTANTTGFDTLMLNIKGIKDKHKQVSSRLFSVYLLDNQRGNPHATWVAQGKPVFPTRKQLQAMRNQQEPVRIKGPTKLEEFSMTFYLSKPGVLLLHLCDKPTEPPGQVSDVRLHSITSQDTLVIWNDAAVGSRCILTYQVEFSNTSMAGPYQRVNAQDIIFTSFVHSVEDTQSVKQRSKSWYRICAVDYWGQKGQYSIPINMPTV